MDSKEPFNAIKSSQIKFSQVKNKQNEFLNKLSDIKIGKKTTNQKGEVNNMTIFYLSREEVINFLETILKCYLMQITMQNKMKLREKDLKY